MAASSSTYSLDWISKSPAETDRLARAFAAILHGGEILSLSGDLGAGKTTFTRALARALGIQRPVTSPTFVLQKTYEVPFPCPVSRLIHYDLYRLASYDELLDLGFEDVSPDVVRITEWGDKFESFFPYEPIRMTLQYLDEERRRILIAFPDRARGEELAAILREA